MKEAACMRALLKLLTFSSDIQRTSEQTELSRNRSMPEQFRSVFTAGDALKGAQCESEPRIVGPFAALVRGTNARGEHFQIETELDDLSAADCNLRLRQHVKNGAMIFVVARLHKALVAMHSIVLKAEPQEAGQWCLSLGIIHHRFLAWSDSRFRSLLLPERPAGERHDSKESS